MHITHIMHNLQLYNDEVIFNGDFVRENFAGTGIRTLDLPTHVFFIAACMPWCIFYLLSSKYISHMYAGKNQRINCSHALIICYTMKARNKTYLTEILNVKNFAGTGI